ncbi:hypothetical protein ES288_A06G177500v1 [Gossypium darwinii]|uniref:Uncharacterized protein n=1 Tax=Gossypium darwinii TaxID=34276 RepID=A0A5D2G736_GOSDA|nr:hypothetical protein ES288_A06G177500v1 [Gossypium darwinii]TYH13915.1 hypothetical protein ES288_A06G177500v1 [Gossypium darwinii]TYH13916.1 hypothetical protein ES288_A06G177500v1 [Gossypium darwinii]
MIMKRKQETYSSTPVNSNYWHPLKLLAFSFQKPPVLMIAIPKEKNKSFLRSGCESHLSQRSFSLGIVAIAPPNRTPGHVVLLPSGSTLMPIVHP